MRTSKLLRFTVAVTIAASAGRANAQASAAGGAKLEEIVVTAQRREENLRDVPLTVSVATGDDLASRNYTDPAQLQYLVPSLQLTNFQASPGATNFSIRGIGTASFSHLVEPSVATVIDGIVMGRPEMAVMEFSDIERIEVLSGPQGMLFGKNASAGLINIVTTAPRLGENSVSAHAAYESINAASGASDYSGRATLNAAVGESAALRVSAFYSDQNPLIKNINPNPLGDLGRKEAGLRAKLLWKLSDNLDTVFSGDYTSSQGMGTGAYTARAWAPGGSFEKLDQAAGIVAGPNNVYQQANAPTDLHYLVGGLQNETTYTLPTGMGLTNIVGYRMYKSHHALDFDLRPVNALDVASAEFNFSQVTEELRLTSPAHSPVEYQFGLFYYKGKSDRSDYDAGNLGLGTPPAGYTSWLGLDSANNLDSTSYAAYGQGTWHINDAFRLTAGGRYTNDKASLYAVQHDGGALYNIASPPNALFQPSTSASDFSWRVSPQYNFGPTTVGYITVAHGYKGPGFNLGWTGAQSVGPETSLNYEAGIKSDIASNVQLNVSVFWEDFKNFQVQSFDHAAASYFVQNAGKSRSRGSEAQLAWKPVAALRLSAAVAYSDATFTSFTGAACYPGQTVAQGCVAGQADATGNSLANAPKLTASVAADYKAEVSGSLAAFVHADAYSRSTVNFSANGDPNTIQNGYQIANMSIGLGASDERWKASIYCRNCFDKRFVSYIESNPGGAVGDYDQSFAIDSFRAVGASIDVRF